MIGKTLGPYKIIEQLGAGGMGEVYLGEDTRLGRKVAIKVLPAEFAGDPERLARFEQEARAAAALNHPHIAVVHDVGSEPAEDGTTTHFMVQEYLEGDTLREPLKKGTLPLQQTLSLATEIAEALTAAHAAGIVHRDLKPENLFITKDGHAKILDFGLAKLTELAPVMSPGTEASKSPTLLGTVAGQMMGTAGYMAPEQVQGAGDIDHRADLFAFGCVLYEMAGGRQPFAGKSVLDTLHKIADEEPEPIAAMNAELPAQLHWVLKKCLAKQPAKRYQTAGDLVVDLQALGAEVDAGTALSLSGEVPAPRVAAETAAGIPWKWGVPIAVAAVVVTALAMWFAARPSPATPTVACFEIPLPEGNLATGTGRRAVAISPDGSQIVFAHDSLLWLRNLDEFEATPIRGTEGARSPFFAPDGEQVGFYSAGELKRVQTTGGAPIPICAAVNPWGVSWAEDGTVFFGQGSEGILSVAATGGEPQPAVSLESGELAHGPQLLPGGEWLLFTLRSADVSSWDDAAIVAQSLINPGDRRELVYGGRDGRYVPTGHIVYARGGQPPGGSLRRRHT